MKCGSWIFKKQILEFIFPLQPRSLQTLLLWTIIPRISLLLARLTVYSKGCSRKCNFPQTLVSFHIFLPVDSRSSIENNFKSQVLDYFVPSFPPFSAFSPTMIHCVVLMSIAWLALQIVEKLFWAKCCSSKFKLAARVDT